MKNKKILLVILAVVCLVAWMAGSPLNLSRASAAPVEAPRPCAQRACAGPLIVLASNPRYFTDGSGKAVLLSGSHTWLNLQDGVLTDPPPAFNYTGWLDFLSAHNHNFFRLWAWEQAKWVVEATAPYYFSPLPYHRTGPGLPWTVNPASTSPDSTRPTSTACASA